MIPAQLTAAQFGSYPSAARRVALQNLALLQKMPLAFVPLLLREVIAYDWKFPAERAELDRQLAYLDSLTLDQLQQWLAPFAALKLTPELEQFDWVNVPADFSEHLTAHLWATHQIDAFRNAALEYVRKLNAATPAPGIPIPRCTIVIVGQGVLNSSYPLFRKLRPQGVFYTRINPADGVKTVLEFAGARAAQHPLNFGHWYVDGGAKEALASDGLTCVSYKSLESIRASLLGTMETMMRSGSGAEALRSKLARMRPEDLGIKGSGDDAVLQQFEISLLTEGSGTQIFSTTFVQWTAREALRRAQPLTLIARYAPRQHEQSMKEMLAGKQTSVLYDPEGSLVDADMGAYYTWINQQRLPGADRSTFLAWFEGRTEALAIGPSLPRGKVSDEPHGLPQVLASLS